MSGTDFTGGSLGTVVVFEVAEEEVEEVEDVEEEEEEVEEEVVVVEGDDDEEEVEDDEEQDEEGDVYVGKCVDEDATSEDDTGSLNAVGARNLPTSAVRSARRSRNCSSSSRTTLCCSLSESLRF
jgi:hypothetical protein